jgi:site-specific DNA-methyltransferase (adenine-specific)
LDIFDAEIKAGRHRCDLSTNALLKLAGRKVKRRKHDEARQRMAEAAPATDLIRVGDFRQVLAGLPDESVDLIFTDPPYLTADLPIYGSLGEFAKRVLKPGGSLVCYSPTYNLLAATDQVRPHLDFWTALVIRHMGPSSQLNHYHIVARCKLLLWFIKGHQYEGDWICNLIDGDPPDKVAHDWQQGEGEASYYIERMCPPGGLVVDPTCGSGTTVRAALFLGRRVLGCEIDPDRAKVAAKRCDLRSEAATGNPAGWTPWRRAVWLGLLT